MDNSLGKSNNQLETFQSCIYYLTDIRNHENRFHHYLQYHALLTSLRYCAQYVCKEIHVYGLVSDNRSGVVVVYEIHFLKLINFANFTKVDKLCFAFSRIGERS